MMFNMSAISRGCTKGLLLALNVFCMLLATLTFGAGAVDAAILKHYGEDQAVGTLAGDLLIAVISFCLMAIAVFGCVATVKENPKMLYLYVGLILILVVLELMLGVFVAIQRRGLQIRVTDWLREDFFKNSTGEELESHIKLWDNLQTGYECCGLNGPEDYPAVHLPISTSCCLSAFRARTDHAQDLLYKACIENRSYFHLGCEGEILDILQTDAQCLMAMAVLSFWLEAAGMLFAMTLASTVRNSVQVYKHTVKY